MNTKDFATVVQERRSVYAISKDIKVSDARIKEVVEFAVKWTPSSFNSQTGRAVILLGEHHDKFWSSLTEVLRKIVPAEQFAATEGKMKAFGSGYGTVLFFEDQAAVKKLQDAYP